MIRLLLIVVVVFTLIPTAGADSFSPEQLHKAINDLGSSKFYVREKASRVLWHASRAAEPLLRETQTTDPEVRRRIQELLDKFSWGIFPDTPAAVVAQIDLFRGGERDERVAAVDALLRLGKPGYDALLRLTEKETDPAEKRVYFEHIARDAQLAVPGLVAAGDLTRAADLLDRSLLAGSDEAFSNYAAFQALDGKLDPAIERWQKAWHDKKSAIAAKMLVHLFRARGDFARAREFAKQIDDSLLLQVLWEEGNWKALARLLRMSQGEAHDAAGLGMRAAVYRLAGDRESFHNVVEQLCKLAKTGDSFELRTAAESLLLNGRTQEAMAILLDRKLAPALTFDLLFAQMRYKEAFELSQSARSTDKDEAFRLELRTARALMMLGDRDQAMQRFNSLAGRLRSPSESSSARDLVKTLDELNLREQASAFAARYLALTRFDKGTDAGTELFDALFGPDAELALEWWCFLRNKLTNPAGERCMSVVGQIVAGKPVEHLVEWANELAHAKPSVGPDRSNAEDHRVQAAAVAMLRAGREAKALEYFNLSLEQKPSAAEIIYFADYWRSKGRFKEAADWYKKAETIEPGNALALFLQGISSMKAGNATEGSWLMELAHRVPLGSETARAQFAQELEQRGFVEGAKREIDALLTFGWYRSWQMGNVLNRAAQLAARNRDYEGAVAWQEKAIAGCMWKAAGFSNSTAFLSVPQSTTRIRVRALLEAAKFDEAMVQTRAALEVLPGNIELVILVVHAFDAAGRRKQADELFNSVLARHESLCRGYPNCGFGHNACAWLSVNCSRELDKALLHAEAAVRLEPQETGWLDTLAEVHFCRGEFTKAIELRRLCLKRQPDRPYFQKQLARYLAGDRKAPIPDADDD